MAGVKKVILVGNVGSEPEMRFTPNGHPVTNFSLAVNTKRGENEETTWFRVATFGKTAEICNQYLAKGRQVYIEGGIRLNEWESQDGTKRASLEVAANVVQMLGSAPKQDTTEAPTPGDLEPDDMPF